MLGISRHSMAMSLQDTQSLRAICAESSLLASLASLLSAVTINLRIRNEQDLHFRS